ncbi:hypothetical protein D3C86_1421400 [compost metagenome]
MPAVNSAIRESSSSLRGRRPVRAVSTGAPTATPSAYRLTSRPADGTEMCRSAAMVGIRPTITNSVVPMAKALIVSASKAIGMSNILKQVFSMDAVCRVLSCRKTP